MGWKEELEFAVQALSDLLKEEKTLSAYEIHNSSMVQVLLHCLSGQVHVQVFLPFYIYKFSFQRNLYLIIKSRKDKKFLSKYFQT